MPAVSRTFKVHWGSLDFNISRFRVPSSAIPTIRSWLETQRNPPFSRQRSSPSETALQTRKQFTFFQQNSFFACCLGTHYAFTRPGVPPCSALSSTRCGCIWEQKKHEPLSESCHALISFFGSRNPKGGAWHEQLPVSAYCSINTRADRMHEPNAHVPCTACMSCLS